MARTIFTFLFGLVSGVALVLLLQDRPIDVQQLRDGAGVAMDSAGRGARNLTLEASVRTALALQRDFSLMGGIGVEAEDGHVVLSGTVQNEDQKTLAGLIARGVDGVDGVDNQLQVDPER